MLSKVENISFGANVVLGPQVLNSDSAFEVEESFRAKSLTYPNDVVSLTKNNSELNIAVNNFNVGALPEDISEDFLGKPKEYIVEKLVKLLRVYKLLEKGKPVVLNHSYLLQNKLAESEPINNYRLLLMHIAESDEILRHLKLF